MVKMYATSILYFNKIFLNWYLRGSVLQKKKGHGYRMQRVKLCQVST